MRHAYRLPPCDIYDIPAMESWFTDMASKGFVLDKIGRTWFRFKKSEPSVICFRMEPITNEDEMPNQEMLDYYDAAGWSYVATLNKLFFIWKSTRLDAEELHSDPIVQSIAYERLCKRLTRDAVGCAIAVAALLAIIICTFVFYPRPVMLFLTSPVYLVLAVVEIITAVQMVLRAQEVRQLKRALSQGFAAPHHKNYRQGFWSRHIINVLSFGLSVAVLVVSILTLTLDWKKSISDISEPLPYLSLDMIEQSADFIWPDEPFLYKGVNAWNSISYAWTPLVPVYYSLYQQGAEQEKLWKDESGHYAPSAQTEYYQLAIAAFAPTLLEELMEQHIQPWNHAKLTEISHSSFNRVVLSQADEFAELFAYRGKQVIYIRYYGHADLSERLDSLARTLDLALIH